MSGLKLLGRPAPQRGPANKRGSENHQTERDLTEHCSVASERYATIEDAGGRPVWIVLPARVFGDPIHRREVVYMFPGEETDDLKNHAKP